MGFYVELKSLIDKKYEKNYNNKIPGLHYKKICAKDRKTRFKMEMNYKVVTFFIKW